MSKSIKNGSNFDVVEEDGKTFLTFGTHKKEVSIFAIAETGETILTIGEQEFAVNGEVEY